MTRSHSRTLRPVSVSKIAHVMAVIAVKDHVRCFIFPVLSVYALRVYRPPDTDPRKGHSGGQVRSYTHETMPIQQSAKGSKHSLFEHPERCWDTHTVIIWNERSRPS